MPAQEASASALILRAGTVVTVALAEPIDSDHDPVGKRYAASVSLIDGVPIARGAGATVVLLDNNSGWHTQLTELRIDGRELQALSDAGSVAGGGQGNQASASGGILAQMGFAPATAPLSERVLLPAATQLRFVLMGSVTAAPAVAASRRRGIAEPVAAEPVVSPAPSIAASPREPEVAYLCRASDTPDRVFPVGYYIADVFKTSDSPAVVESRWYEFLVTTYPYRFANNRHANIRCIRLMDAAADRERLEGEWKSENPEVVETRWHYTLGPPPTPVPFPAGATLPRDTQ